MEYAGTKIAFDYYLSTVFHSQPALQALYSQIFEASEIPSESLLSCLGVLLNSGELMRTHGLSHVCLCVRHPYIRFGFTRSVEV